MVFSHRSSLISHLLNYDRDHADVTYSGGGLPLASHWMVMDLSKGSAIMGPDELLIMVGGCSTIKTKHKDKMITKVLNVNISD